MAVRYHVRNAHGSVSFDNFLELERAYVQGLVDPEDEVREEGAELWRKAGSMPLLVKARGHHRRMPLGDQALWVMAGVFLACVAFYSWASERYRLALVLAFILCAVLSRVTYKAFTQFKSKSKSNS